MTKPEDRAYEYGERKGYLQKKRILTYIKKGNRHALERIVLSPQSRDEWLEIFSDDLDFACASFEYVWSQACLVAMQEGISESAIGGIFMQYRQQLGTAETVREVLDLSAAFHLQLADFVAAQKLERQYSPVVQRCRAYIHEHIGDPLTVSSVAAVVGYSRSHLSKVFREETGDTIRGFIQQEKLDLARRFLLSLSHPMSDIWRELGFCSQSHFAAFFRKMTGQTPSQFRKSSQIVETADASEVSVVATVPGAMKIVAEDGESEDYQKTLKGLHDYAENVGFQQELYLLYCVRKGKVHELQTELDDPEYDKTMKALFRNNRTLAYETLLFLLPQIHSAAVNSGVSMKDARKLYMDFSERARDADVPELLRILRDAYIEFATRVDRI
ncbi:MAG: AraC family transcriptional regulator [Spirochaetia bacterium]|nr:AraC family transcriptional regulator [Spirochaetia bacterium]